MPQTLSDFCQKVHARLPELLWMLPYWPKAYSLHIPNNLFESSLDWTPEQAIQEIAKHLSRLQMMGEDSAKARFLADKISRQINVLVMISKMLPIEKNRHYRSTGLTRDDYQQSLMDQEHLLLLQKQALFKAMQHLPDNSEVAKEYQAVLDSLTRIKGLMV